MIKIRRTLLCIMLLSLVGCGVNSQEDRTSSGEKTITSMEEEPYLSYEVPVSLPNIVINQLGYPTKSVKVAVFSGNQIPVAFQVIDADTGNVMYGGALEDKGVDDETGEHCCYGDFTDLETPGTYYIEAPYLGRSYSFSIADDIYNDVFREACKQYYYNRCGITLTEDYAGDKAHNACHTANVKLREDSSASIDVSGGWHQDEKGSKDVVKAAQNIGVMLLAYELHGNAFTDDIGIPESGNQIPDLLDEIKYEIEWLAKMQEPSTGAVYAGVTNYDQGISYVEPVSMEASRAFAMALAKFSYLYQVYDTEYATNCLKAADRAWKYALLNDRESLDSWKFAAAAELYRASGLSSCKQYVYQYLTLEKYKQALDVPDFLGCITYISTKQTVDMSLCEEITKTLMDRAEVISGNARLSMYFTTGNAKQDNNRELLDKMMYLTTVNDIISNHEYQTIIMNHLHYFMGRNRKSISYIDQVGSINYVNINEKLGIMKKFDEDSKLIFMLSEIIAE